MHSEQTSRNFAHRPRPPAVAVAVAVAATLRAPCAKLHGQPQSVSRSSVSSVGPAANAAANAAAATIPVVLHKLRLITNQPEMAVTANASKFRCLAQEATREREGEREIEIEKEK